MNLKQAAKEIRITPTTLRKWYNNGIASATGASCSGKNFLKLDFNKKEVERLKKMNKWSNWK